MYVSFEVFALDVLLFYELTSKFTTADRKENCGGEQRAEYQTKGVQS